MTNLDKKGKAKIAIVVVSCMVILISIFGYTYSYFSATVTSVNDTSTIIRSGQMALKFTGKTEINENSIVPGDKVTKTFEVENLSAIPATYNIFFEKTTNEFTEDLVYTLSDTNGIVVDETPVPETGNDKVYAKTGISIPAAPGKHEYTLTIEYKYSSTINQSATKGSILRTTVGIDTEQNVNQAIAWSVVPYTITHSDEENVDILTINNEDFYILSQTNDKIVALAKYNLDVHIGGNSMYEGCTYGRQCDQAISNTGGTNGPGKVSITVNGNYKKDRYYYKGYDYDNYNSSTGGYPLLPMYGETYPANVYNSKRAEITIKEYIFDYIDYLKNGLETDSLSGRLIEKEELEALGCKEIVVSGSYSNFCPQDKPWIYSSTYHTAVAISSSYVMYVTSDNNLYTNATDIGNAGLRPVIELQLKKPSKEITRVNYTVGHDSTYDVDTINIGNETFYVMSSTPEKITAIAKWNLRVGYQGNTEIDSSYDNYEIQYEGAKGYAASGVWSAGDTVKFANTNYWMNDAGEYPRNVLKKSSSRVNPQSGATGNDFNIQYYLENYKDYLTAGKDSNLSIRLATIDDINPNGTCSANQPCQDIPQYMDHTSYWTSTAGSAGSVYAFRAIEATMGDGKKHGMYHEQGYSNTADFGVRPVIEIDLT